MLHDSLPGSSDSSRPQSPHRRLTHAIGGNQTDTNHPPPGVEFVGSSPAPSGTSHGISSTAFSPNYYERFFVEERELGRGGKGVVLLVKHVLDGVSLGHFALKRIPVGDDHEWLKKVLVEVQLLQHLSHQNLVSYRHVWLEDVQITTFGPSVPCAFILQQYCDAGDLHNYIYRGVGTTTSKELLKQRLRRKSKNEPEPVINMNGPRRLHFEEIYAFFKDIASGLNHLHINNYIHRDLKPNNCLLHETGKGLRVLVSDFGEVQSENQVRQSTGATGTISYCAPEVLRRDPLTGVLGNFTTKSDIFSLGMILYFLCFAKLPYQNADNLNEENEDIDLLREEIVTWSGLEDLKSVRPDLPDRLYKVLRRLLSLDPNKRPSAEDILHGIKTGTGLEESADARPRSVSHIFDDMEQNSRISPVDATPSASPGPATQRLAQKPTLAHGRVPVPSQLKLSSPSLDTDIQVSEAEEDESDGPVSPSGSLVLRSRHSSPVKVSPPSPLLPPSYQWYLQSTESVRTVKIGAFLVKIISIYLPCLPAAAKPTTGLPLLGLATVDVLLSDSGVLASAVLLVVHFIVLSFVMRMDSLCLPARVWEDL